MRWTIKLAGEPFEGYVDRNEGFGDEQPVISLIHAWDALDDYEQRRADILATQGYTVFAIYLYGRGVRPANVDEALAESGKLYGDRNRIRERLFAGLEMSKEIEGVDPENTALFGYCFGGAATLEFARSGAELDSCISFHASFGLP